ncbi:MAG TPA: hypothetical protein VMJ32_18065 [Pirellulales bacterium]|nr:hypothetical protein [Pirellulales bacterium]
MTQSTINSDVNKSIAKDFLTAVILHAEFRARLAIAALQALDMIPPEKTGNMRIIDLPKACLLELAAVFELFWWERCGIRDHIAAGLPCFADALEQLAIRAEKGPQEFADPQAVSLSHRVLQFWMMRFSHNGLGTLGADIFVQGIDEEQFVQLIADFAWQNRECISKLFNGKGE